MTLVDSSTYSGHKIEIFESRSWSTGKKQYVIHIDGISRRTTNTLSNATSIARIVAGGMGPKETTSPPEKETRDLRSRESDRRRNNATTQALSTGACGLCFLLSAHLTGTDRLIAISLGGLLALGGSR
jgi:hypothetical protein